MPEHQPYSDAEFFADMAALGYVGEGEPAEVDENLKWWHAPPPDSEIIDLACAPIACDHCPKPGHCCTGFTLDRKTEQFASADETMLEVLVKLAAHEGGRLADGRPTIGLPFLPLGITQRDGVRWWRYWCPRLTSDGRCGDYENRPMLCRTYRPGQDGLCAIYRPTEAEPGLPKEPLPSPPLGA